MENIVNLHLPGPLSTPASLPTCAASLAGWLAGYSENIEWKAFSFQPVSQSPGEGGGFGWGRAGFDPRVLWQSLGLRNLEILFYRPVSPSTHAFMASPFPICSIQLILAIHLYIYILYICVCLFACTDTWVEFFLRSQLNYRKTIFLGIQFPSCPFARGLISEERNCFISHVFVSALLAISLKDYSACRMSRCCVCLCTRIRSVLPGLGQHRSALLRMCSGSPAPVSRNPSLCLAAGAGSLWKQKAACNSARQRGKQRNKNNDRRNRR